MHQETHLYAWIPGTTNSQDLIHAVTGEPLYGDLNREQLREKYPSIEFLTLEELDAEIAKLIITDPTPITHKEWNEALEVLYPFRWKANHKDNFEFFVMSEFTIGHYTAIYIKHKSKYYSLTDSAYISAKDLQEKFFNWLNNQ